MGVDRYLVKPPWEMSKTGRKKQRNKINALNRQDPRWASIFESYDKRIAFAEEDGDVERARRIKDIREVFVTGCRYIYEKEREGGVYERYCGNRSACHYEDHVRDKLAL